MRMACSAAVESRHGMNSRCQRNQQFEIYNQKIEILKKLTAKQPAEPDRFLRDIHGL